MSREGLCSINISLYTKMTWSVNRWGLAQDKSSDHDQVILLQLSKTVLDTKG
jgi:hypothetical protein